MLVLMLVAHRPATHFPPVVIFFENFPSMLPLFTLGWRMRYMQRMHAVSLHSDIFGARPTSRP